MISALAKLDIAHGVPAELRKGSVLNFAEYETLYRENLNRGNAPVVAVLQAKPETERELAFERLSALRRRGVALSADKYNIVYIRDLPYRVGEDGARTLCAELYRELNEGRHPDNYYGYSLSMGHIVVIRNDSTDLSAYYVDTVGFAKLPESFLDQALNQKLGMRMDVAQERNLLRQIRDWEQNQSAPNRLLLEGDIARLESLDSYLKPIEDLKMRNNQKGNENMREIIPIREYPDMDGRYCLSGNEIGRRRAYDSVRQFEQDNHIEQPVIDERGQYEDKDFLYMAYDEYVAMSHREELEPYRERFAADVEREAERLRSMHYVPDKERLFNNRLAEVYYAKQAGLTEEQIADMVGEGNRDSYLMREIRKLHEGGVSKDGIDAVLRLKQNLSMEYAGNFLSWGGSVDLINAMAEDVDSGTAYLTLSAVMDGEISEKTAVSVFRAVEEVRLFNQEQQKFSLFDLPYVAETMIEMGKQGLAGADIEATVADWLKNGAKIPLREQPVVHGAVVQIKPNSLGKGEQWVAVESTDDYVSAGFWADIIDTDVQNEDGSYGKKRDKYRVVTIGEDAQLRPYNERIFLSREEALASVADNELLRVVAYDDIVNEAARRQYDQSRAAEVTDLSDAPQEVKEQLLKNAEELERRDSQEPDNSELSAKDRLKQQFEVGIRNVMDSDNFKNWLSTSSRFFISQYSFNNAMLVFLQNPNATYTMGFEAWKKFGRAVNKGATGIGIWIPMKYKENFKGQLFGKIKKELTEKLASEPNEQVVAYRLGESKLEFTLNRNNHLYGLRVNGVDQGQLGGEDEVKRFISRSVVGKIPYGFKVGYVFDVADVNIPEYLWMKTGFTPEEEAKDANGRAIKNRKGEKKIINTPERIGRFQHSLDTSIVAKDPEKAAKLFDACVAASERKGIPVFVHTEQEDNTLAGGAKGYFSRAFTEEYPKGFIVLKDGMEIAEKCAVLLHEMAHSDLHGNLEELNKAFGEKVNSKMREVQAEASAFAVAKQFGIESDTSSFAYLAIYSTGFQLQEFSKSLELIYKEAQALTADIAAELDIRGLNIDLSEKESEPISPETIKSLSAQYTAVAIKHDEIISHVTTELPDLMEQSQGNADLIDILRYQRENMRSREEEVEGIFSAVEILEAAESREEQEAAILALDGAVERLNNLDSQFEQLTEQFVFEKQGFGGLKQEFTKDPKKTIEKMAEDYPRLRDLTPVQVEYVAKSRFISSQYAKLLRNKPEVFVDKVCERVDAISSVAAKNGTFVEINYCECWTETPIFEDGMICHPKVAESIISGSEKQIGKIKSSSEGEYIPYTKCNFTVFTPGENNSLVGWNARIDIGDGSQSGLNDFLSRCVGRSQDKLMIAGKVQEALKDRGAKNKMFDPTKAANNKPDIRVQEKTMSGGNRRRSQWNAEIAAAKQAKAAENAKEQGEYSHEPGRE